MHATINFILHIHILDECRTINECSGSKVVRHYIRCSGIKKLYQGVVILRLANDRQETLELLANDKKFMAALKEYGGEFRKGYDTLILLSNKR